MAKAMDEGLPWTIVKSQAIKMYPTLPWLIQAGRQVVGQVQTRETQVELLMSIQQIRTSMGAAPDWSLVAKVAVWSTALGAVLGLALLGLILDSRGAPFRAF